MKRFHVHVGVKDLETSIRFYSALFGQKPTKSKADYAKWMLEDPRLNFAISTRGDIGVDHLGFQVDSTQELEQTTNRLQEAELKLSGVGESVCCYAKSQKAWTSDPSGIAWETYHTMEDADVFSRSKPNTKPTTEESCCG